MDELLSAYKKTSEQWSQFSSIATNTLHDIDTATEQVRNKIKEIEETIANIKILSQHAQADSYVKICPRAYIPATIQHTGEYHVNLNSEYQSVLTRDQTVEYLEELLSEQNGILENYRVQKEQINKRLGFEQSETDDLPDIGSMPEKILTEKGIAFKQGHFYDIVEVEADIPYEKNSKRISRIVKSESNRKS